MIDQEYWSRIVIQGIDQHLTADDSGTYDPVYLYLVDIGTFKRVALTSISVFFFFFFFFFVRQQATDQRAKRSGWLAWFRKRQI